MLKVKNLLITLILSFSPLAIAQSTPASNLKLVCQPENNKIVCKTMEVASPSSPVNSNNNNINELMQNNLYRPEYRSIQAPRPSYNTTNPPTANTSNPSPSSNPPIPADVKCPPAGTISPNGYPIDTFSPVDGSRFTCDIFTGGFLQDIYGFITPEKNPELFAYAAKVFDATGFAQWQQEVKGKKFKADPNSISWGKPASGKPSGDPTLFSFLFASSNGF